MYTTSHYYILHTYTKRVKSERTNKQDKSKSSLILLGTANRVSQLTCLTFWSAVSFDSITPQRFQRSDEPCDKSLQVDLEAMFKEIFFSR